MCEADKQKVFSERSSVIVINVSMFKPCLLFDFPRFGVIARDTCFCMYRAIKVHYTLRITHSAPSSPPTTVQPYYVSLIGL